MDIDTGPTHSRFLIKAFRDGRHYRIVVEDITPPTLQPSNVLGELSLVEGQFEMFCMGLDREIFSIYVDLGTPIEDIKETGDLI